MSDTKKKVTPTQPLTPFQFAKVMTARLAEMGITKKIGGPMIYIYGHRNGWLTAGQKVHGNGRVEEVWVIEGANLDAALAWMEEHCQAIRAKLTD